jgi:multidrug efflux pump subunit AcrA (membrane-fusion protein)
LASSQSAYAAAKGQNEGPLLEAARALTDAKTAELAAQREAQNGNTADLEAATSARKDAEESYRMAKADFDAAMLSDQQALDSANQFLSEAKAGARSTFVRAPISGTVMSLNATVGTEVGAQPKSPVATIVDLSAIEVHATIPAEQKDAIEKGTTVMITASDPGVGPIEGRVTALRVSPPKSGQKSSTYIAAVGFDNGKGEIKPETAVKKVGVATGKVQNVLVVPMGAVSQNKDGKMVIKVQKGSEWVEAPVETGLSDGALIEIKSGVDEGAIVMVTTVIPKT